MIGIIRVDGEGAKEALEEVMMKHLDPEQFPGITIEIQWIPFKESIEFKGKK